MKKEIKNILFDFGGVIVGINKDGALKRFKEIGLATIGDYLNEFRQSGIFLEYEEGKITPAQFYDAFRELAGNDKITDLEIDSGWLAFLDGIAPYKFDLLKELRAKYRVNLLSNTNPAVMGWACTSDFSPEGLTITDFFDECYMSYKMGYTKPDQGIYEKMLSMSDMIPEETLFLDDGPANIKMAEELGFQTYLANDKEDLRQVFVDRGLLD